MILLHGYEQIKFVVFFLLGDSPASEFYVPTFWNTLNSIFIGGVCPAYTTYEDGTEHSETSAHKIQTPENRPLERIQHSQHGELLKSRIRQRLLTYIQRTWIYTKDRPALLSSLQRQWQQRSRPINKSGDEPKHGFYATRTMWLSVTNWTGIRMRKLKLDGVRAHDRTSD